MFRNCKRISARSAKFAAAQACIAATAGWLAERLEAGDVDAELFVAAGDIVSALIADRPAQDTDSYDEAAMPTASAANHRAW